MHEQQARSVGHGDLWKEGSVVPTGEKVYVVEDTPRIIRAGETYEMSADQFHETQHVGNTMTVFKRKTMRDTWSKLIVPPGYTAEHSINQQPNPDWLMLQYWNEVKTLPENALDDIINAAHGEDI